MEKTTLNQAGDNQSILHKSSLLLKHGHFLIRRLCGTQPMLTPLENVTLLASW